MIESLGVPLIELLIIAIAVAMATKYLRIPYTVSLVVVGLIIGLTTKEFKALELDKEIILLVFLPPLLFEGALNMDLETLRDNALIVALLALVGTFISTLLIGVVLFFLLPVLLPWSSLPETEYWWLALLLGVMISPTDPVSVLALFKELGVNKRLSVIIEGESVFNDGIGVVLYLIVLKQIDLLQHNSSAPFNWLEGWGTFFQEVVGGILVGLLIGYVVHRMLGRIDDHLIEVVISLTLAFGVYLVADYLHTSGVLAVVVAGLVIGNYGRLFSMSPTTRVTLASFWEVVAFLANSLLFLLLGLRLNEANLVWSGYLVSIGVTFGLLLLVRAFIVYLLCFGLSFLKVHLPWSWRHTIQWGGLRGSIPVALVLGLSTEVPFRPDLTAIVFGVVLLSLLIQGLTMKRLLIRLGLVGIDEHREEFETHLGQTIALKASLNRLEELYDNGEISLQVYENLRAKLTRRKEQLTRLIGQMVEEHDMLREAQTTRALRRLLLAQRAALDEAFQRGILSEQVLNRLRRDIDARLDEELEPIFLQGEEELIAKKGG